MDHSRRTHTAAGAPEAIGPYSHAVSSQGLLFCSGQIPLDPQSGELVGDDATNPASFELCNPSPSVFELASELRVVFERPGEQSR